MSASKHYGSGHQPQTRMQLYLTTAKNTAVAFAYVGAIGGGFLGLPFAAPIGMTYMYGFNHPTEYHGWQPVAEMGARHSKAVSEFVDGLKVSVKTNFESLTAKAFVEEVAATVPSTQQIGEMKQEVAGRLNSLEQMAKNLKEGDLELVDDGRAHLNHF